jgi:beta-glucosidase/6-phospho-beta-glucosidase/beta-galactosidase
VFPKSFMFGPSLSGFQFEMGNPNEVKELDTQTDWFVWVRDLENLLNDIVSGDLPENKDKYRSQVIISHLYAVEKAMNEGVDVRGYLHWSIVDNYEWAKGYSKRFGLAYTDLEKKTYIPRPSMYVFREIARTRSIDQFKGYDPYNLMKF